MIASSTFRSLLWLELGLAKDPGVKRCLASATAGGRLRLGRAVPVRCPPMSGVGIVGAGAMGSAFAERLLACGHRVRVWNRTRAALEPLVVLGAAAAQSPAEVAADSDFVITIVRDAVALAAVTEGAQGIAAGAHPGLIAIEMSTVGPDAIRALRETLPASTTLLDAPVHGPPSAALTGSLAIFVGGDADVLEQARPVLELLGSVLHIGPLGSAAGAKLIVQTTLVGTLALLGEALALAEAFHVPRDLLFDVLAQTPLAAQAQRRRPMLESGDYSASFRLSLARKDMDLVAETAQRAGLYLRLDEAGRSWLLDAEHDGRGDQDYTAIIPTILEHARAAPSGGSDAR
jgi:3-hydroxyisobutyrate dehydrogenase/2-hydroxy-3-oxopropionate reductase